MKQNMKEYEIIVETKTTVYVAADSDRKARNLAIKEAIGIEPDDIRTKIVGVESE